MKSTAKTISKKESKINSIHESLSNVLDKLHGKFCWGLPNYSIDTALKLKKLDLDNSKLDNLIAKISSKVNDKDFIPIFSISSSEYLVYKYEKSVENIYVFDPEHKALLFYSAFEQFLRYNIINSKNSYLKEIEDEYNKTQNFYANKKYKECQGFIKKYQAFLNDYLPCNHEQKNLISNAFNLIGLVYKEFENFEEANKAFYKAFQFKNEYAALNLVYSLIKNIKDYNKAKNLINEIRDEAVLSYTHFYLDYYEGLNSLYNGQIDNALKFFKKIPKTWKKEKEYLDKFTKNIGELCTEFPKLESLKF